MPRADSVAIIAAVIGKTELKEVRIMPKRAKKTAKRRRSTLKRLPVKVQDMPARSAVRVKGGRAQITLT